MARAASLGGVETLVSLPVHTSHHGFTDEQLARPASTPGMVRVSLGVEDAADLIADVGARAGRRPRRLTPMPANETMLTIVLAGSACISRCSSAAACAATCASGACGRRRSLTWPARPVRVPLRARAWAW